jgi:translation initiation factor IF-2
VQRSVRETLASMVGGPKARKRRKESHPEPGETTTKVRVTEFMTIGELANLVGLEANDVIKYCLGLGLMANINKRLERDMIELIADEFGFEIEFGEEYGTEFVESVHEEEKDIKLVPRPPVVTIMGHVDHGKTSLLDRMRRSRLVAGEIGGITQHIGAYEVEVPKGKIVFLDTPGHEAFTAMRARGAEATDIVVLVVAADDGVMPQTIEAINHARAARVPIVVAVNKIDLPDANPQQVRQELSKHGLVAEEWGGDTVFVDISAKMGRGVDKLLEMLVLVAEMKDLKASPTRLARGVVVESRIDQGRGIVGTILVQDGTLHVGDSFVCGAEGGRVRALYDDRGMRLAEAPPSKPVEVLGWSGLAKAGDAFQVLRDEHRVRDIMLRRQQIKREQQMRRRSVVNLANLHQQIAKGEIRDLNVVLKADAQGSVEVLADAFEKLSGDEVRVNILHRGVGNVNESDVLLAAASNALVFGFHVRKEPRASATAEREKVDINLYEVIYEAVDELKLAIEGMLKPEEVQHVTGRADVRQVFRIPRLGAIAGSYVSSGTAARTARARVIRGEETVFDGRVASLRRFKDDVKEVEAGLECGIGLEGFDAMQEGDVIEFYETEQILRKIS